MMHLLLVLLEKSQGCLLGGWALEHSSSWILSPLATHTNSRRVTDKTQIPGLCDSGWEEMGYIFRIRLFGSLLQGKFYLPSSTSYLISILILKESHYSFSIVFCPFSIRKTKIKTLLSPLHSIVAHVRLVLLFVLRSGPRSRKKSDLVHHRIMFLGVHVHPHGILFSYQLLIQRERMERGELTTILILS